MIIRLLIAGFASLVVGLSYFTGMARLMTGLLVGFGAFCSLLFGVLFSMPVDADRLLFPVYTSVAAWPYFVIGAILVGMIVMLFLLPMKPLKKEQVGAVHFKYLCGGIGGYITSLFLSSIYWFPSDSKKLLSDTFSLGMELLMGTCLFLIGICVSCYLLYLASRGTSDRHPDLMRRFVLGLFAFFQLDKVPVLVTYLLIYSPEAQANFPGIAAISLVAYLPVSALLIKTTWDCRE